MRRLALGMAAALAACTAFSSSEPPSPPPANDTDAAVEAGVDAGGSDTATVSDATSTEASASDAFVPPACFVTAAAGPAPTTIEMSPNPAFSGQALSFEAKSSYAYTNVAFKVCLANGTVLTDHESHPIKGSYIWPYTRPGGLPKGWAQLQFWGEPGSPNPLLPRATLIVEVR